MHVKTPQYEISAKNHIFSVKTKPSRAQSTHHWEKKVIGKSSILAQGKSCVLPTDPFCQAKLITFQCIQVTDNDFADRWSAGSHPFLPPSSWFFHPFPKQRACWQAIFIIAGKWEVCDWPRWWGTTQRNTCTPCVVWWRWLLVFPLHKPWIWIILFWKASIPPPVTVYITPQASTLCTNSVSRHCKFWNMSC